MLTFLRTRVRALVAPNSARRAPALLALALVAVLGLPACSIAVDQPTNCDNGISAPITVKKDVRGSTVVIAQVLIEGHGPYQMAVDTGASISIVDKSIADAAGLPVAGPAEPIAGVGGSQNAIPVRVSHWSIGQIRLPAARIATLSLADAQRAGGIVGLLGSDILSQFGVVSVDYGTGTLIVYQQVVPAPTGTAARAQTARPLRTRVAARGV